ncbi:MAG: DNA polymerase III subunit [Desulfitobacteriaceae bacterium]|nr:DNA polymerase III subunit [Desulfitobacteriaceae bacterium]MDD4345378.1 DNA polymerase III subunit [Desulfitobacteriaceae bacterium]MDD4400299.1 DNA polymerase III subunit [Desulfitobacteriaceae bacterium]
MNLTLKLLEKEAYSQQIAHLLLFHGGSSKDRRDVSLRLGQILNCRSLKASEPCQQCSACHKILSGNHPDVTRLEPLKTSIGIEQILAWQERLYRKHYEGNYKVFLIEKADHLTIPAANALLKVTEEPPERTVIILSAENEEGILPTLRSRAQSTYFPTGNKEQWLESLGDIDLGEAEQAFELSGQNPDLALAIMEYGVNPVKEWLDKFWRVIEQSDFLGLFPLFPLKKELAEIYLQVMAVRIQAGIKEGRFSATNILTISYALEGLRQQANPRLVIEVLALQLFQQGGTLHGRSCGSSV